MNTKQLRQKILDLAIRGKLIPQDPANEPASALLERVRAEKERLIKEGKIKRNKKDSVIFRGDTKLHYGNVPFDVPDGWAWCRLGDVCLDFQYGTSQKSEKQGKVAVLRMGNLQKGEVDYNDLAFTSDEADIKKYSLNSNEILFNRTNSPEWVGKTAIYRGEMPAIFAGYLIRVAPVMINPFYLNFLMNSEYHRSICLQVKTDGVNQSNINARKLSNFIYPLPPLAEQRRIVTAIESAFTVIDEIERNKADLQAAVSATKQKILALAIRGKFVPQDPNDESTSILLERIRAERGQHIKAGKIKREQEDPAIIKSDDKSYYENLPVGWAMYPIERLFFVVGGGTPSTANLDYWGDGVPWFSSADIDEKGNVSPRRCVTQLGIDNSTTNVVPEGSIVIVTRVGLGKVAVLNRKMCFSQDNQALIPRYPEVVHNRYLFYFLFQEMQTLKYSGRGTTISGITKKQLTDINLLLPPITEQRRIVVAIEAAFEELDIIAEKLS